MPVSTKGDLEFYLREARKTKGKILEIACGTGRITIPMRKEGIDVVGIDHSSEMIKVIRRKAKNEEIELNVVCSDMINFKFTNNFDLIIIPYRSFLCLRSAEKQKTALKNIFDHLKNNGRLILNFFNPKPTVLANYRGEKRLAKGISFKHPDSGLKTLIWISKICDSSNQQLKQNFTFEELNCRDIVIRTTVLSVTLRYIYRFEFQNFLELAGFKKHELYGGFDYQQFLSESKEMVWIAKKQN